MESKMMKLGLVLGLLAMMVSSSMQLHVNHPMYDAVHRVNEMARARGVPILGLILTSPNDEKLLISSGYFFVDFFPPPITIAGRTYNFGIFKGIPAVYVLAGEPLAAASVTVQIMLDNFHIGTILSIGGGRSVDEKLALGDIAVPYSSAYTSVWYWEEWESPSVSKTPNATLRFGDYNYPEAGENKLASIKAQSVTKYTPTNSKKTTFWFYIPDTFQKAASNLTNVELHKCLEQACNEEAKVVVGGKVGSSDIYLVNHDYGKFLNRKLGISIVDKLTAAVGATAYANGKQFAVIKAVTNKPGEKLSKDLIALATINSYKLAAAFVNQIPQPRFNLKRHDVA